MRIRLGVDGRHAITWIRRRNCSLEQVRAQVLVFAKGAKAEEARGSWCRLCRRRGS